MRDFAAAMALAVVVPLAVFALLCALVALADRALRWWHDIDDA